MRGRRLKPSHLKIVEGTAGRRPSIKNEPKPKRILPEAPEHLPERVAAAWSTFASILDRMGILTEADLQALLRLAELSVEVAELSAKIHSEGRTYETINEKGSLMFRPRPEVSILADADRRLRAYLVEFGLTPSARARVKVERKTSADIDPAEAYFG